jgi:hypothetical protein
MGCVVLEQNCLSGLPGEVAAEPSKANLRHFGERGVPWLSLHISIYKQRARRGLENVISARGHLQYQRKTLSFAYEFFLQKFSHKTADRQMSGDSLFMRERPPALE